MNEKIETKSIVNSYTEWDPLEEVIVGILDGMVVPQWHIAMYGPIPKQNHNFFKETGACLFPKELVEKGKEELDEFVRILEGEGVIVKRPEPVSHLKPFSTPHWSQPCGFYSAMPRDCLFVYGDEIIEAPMSWRSRYFETFAYRKLLKYYFDNGAKWTSAPKPELKDDLFDDEYPHTHDEKFFKPIITEDEPTFDAADFTKCGKDIIAQLSHVTNRSGIKWLQRHLGDKCRIHVVETDDISRMHIDATLVPLAPGKLLANSKVVNKVPDIFKSWDVIMAPEPCLSENHSLYMSSRWITINTLMIDEKRIVVEKGEERLIKTLKDYDFNVIPCNFKHFHTFGGGFHCATLDIRRQGTLESYL